MISSEVQRTLVKSPPELWAEISDPESLARHLGEFGEIRITRVQPEQKVEWEANDASGTVMIKPSGWGTKVKLTVTRELAAETEAAAAVPQPESIDAETEDSAVAKEDAAPRNDAAGEPEAPLAEEGQHDLPPPDSLEPEEDREAQSPIATEPDGPEPRPRPGFFARLFARHRVRRGRIATLVAELDAEAEPPTPIAAAPHEHGSGPYEVETGFEPESSTPALAEQPPSPESFEELESVRSEEAEAEPTANLAAELGTTEEAAAEQVTAVLTGVLDRLGAAHHRPFSRA